MSYAMNGFGAFGAFNANQQNCGDVKWMQTALKAVGFNPGPIDGIMGPQTQAAMFQYATSKLDPTMLYNPAAPARFCNALSADYVAKTGGGGSQPPAPGGGGDGQCPAGTMNIFGACVPNPFAQQPQPQPTPTPTQPGACPPGTVGVPPACVSISPTPGGGGYQPPIGPYQQPQKPGLSTNKKLAIAGIVVAVGVVAVGIAFGKKKPASKSGIPATVKMTPNRRSRKRARRNLRRRSGGGKVRTVGKGKRRRPFGHTLPPKKYRRMGAVRKSQYAWPSGYAYPIHDRKHVRAALTRFSQYKSDYPKDVRRTIAKRLNMAKKRFGIGGPRVKP